MKTKIKKKNNKYKKSKKGGSLYKSFDIIDKIVYINLDSRKDRRKHIETQIKMMDVDKNKVLRFPAIFHKKGYIGCSKSHLEVINMAKKNNWKNVLIFEDDFTFIQNIEEIKKKINIFFKREFDWNVLMLAYNDWKLNDYDNNLKTCTYCGAPSGYLVNNKFYDKLIENMSKSVNLLETGSSYNDGALDRVWFELQDKKWFVMYPRVGSQIKSYSDIENRLVDYML